MANLDYFTLAIVHTMRKDLLECENDMEFCELFSKVQRNLLSDVESLIRIAERIKKVNKEMIVSEKEQAKEAGL
jgi:hypothetical protein